MKTIGQCKNCNHWNSGKCERPDFVFHGLFTKPDKWCPACDLKNIFSAVQLYLLMDWKDLKIQDIQRENDAAFDRIQKLSEALVNLGIDPTQIR